MKLVISGVIAMVVAGAAFADDTADVAKLRDQLDAVTKRMDELEKSKGSSEKVKWAEKVTVKGDFRYRYEYRTKEEINDKNRHRIRARVGAYGQVNDQVKAGIRIASGSDESPTSTNQTLDDFSAKKTAWIDLAYLTYSPDFVDGFSTTLGKMKKSWKSVSDLMMDGDVNPEGAAFNYKLKTEPVTLDNQVAYHVMTQGEVAQISAQSVLSTEVAEDIKLSAGGGFFLWDEIAGTTNAVQKGNTVDAGNNYMYGYKLVDVIAAIDIKKGPVPVKLYAEYISNIADGVAEDNDTAWLAGVTAKYKKLKLDYTYRDVEADAIIGALADGDFGGTNYDGHRVKIKYNVGKNFDVGATVLLYDKKGTDYTTTQVDFMAKF